MAHIMVRILNVDQKYRRYFIKKVPTITNNSQRDQKENSIPCLKSLQLALTSKISLA